MDRVYTDTEINAGIKAYDDMKRERDEWRARAEFWDTDRLRARANESDAIQHCNEIRVTLAAETARAKAAESKAAALEVQIEKIEENLTERIHEACTFWTKGIREERDAMRALVLQFRAWDMLDSAADGPFWKRTIDEALRAGEKTAGEGEAQV